MTLEEFSNGFDLLVSSYQRFKAFDNKEILDSIEFDEYEKSQFLTDAQEEVVLSLYTGKNPYGESFETTEEMRRYLANLVKEAQLEPIQNTTGILGMESYSKFFTLPSDTWFITYESVQTSDGACGEGSIQDVYPVKQDEYHKIRKNPFRGANSRRTLRLDLADGVIEIISKNTVTKYYVRYLKKLRPIVLTTMPDGVTVDGEASPTPCEVHESLHQRILDLAVRKGLESKGIRITKDNNENR